MYLNDTQLRLPAVRDQCGRDKRGMYNMCSGLGMHSGEL